MSVTSLKLTSATFEKIGQAIQKTFLNVLNLDFKTSEFHLGPMKYPPKNIAGTVLIKNSNFQGALSIAIPSEIALHIFSKFYESKIEQIDERILDGVGEITNMVYGCLKKELNKDGLEFEMFVPFISVGSQTSPYNYTRSARIANMYLESNVGRIWVELSIEKQVKSKKSPSRKKVA